MSFEDYYAGIPRVTPQFSYDSPPEYGGLRTIYPIVNSTQQYGLFNEVKTDWYGLGSQMWASCRGMGMGTGKIAQHGDVNQFTGAVWSIQLTARPGYYVTPEQLLAMGYDDDDFPPIG
jgi:hypothetical protein